MRISISLFTVLFFLTSNFMVSCQSAAQSTVEHVDALSFRKLLTENPQAQLLDVRTPGEYVKEHLSDAKNIDWRGRSFVSEVDNLSKDKPVYLYCLSGGRSASAANKLTSLGFKKVYNLKGGILAWKKAELPLEAGKNTSSKTGISSADFKAETTSELPVLVNFYAPWCGPCRKMAPMLEKLDSELGDSYKFVKLNADDNDALMKELEVHEIPTFLIYRDGQIIWRHIGLVEKDVLLKELGLN